MFVTKVKRIIKSALVSFWRSRMVSMSSILVMSITLLVFGSLIFANVALDSALTQIKEKVDINVYFITEADEADILAVKESLETLPEVKTIEYVSRDQALINFKENHDSDQTILQALDELNDNPLGAVLNIQAKETSQYESIANFLDDNRSTLSNEGTSIIDKINYYQNKLVIDRLTKIVDSSEKFGFIATIVLVILSILITFNTIRLTIYISRDEISVMRLVGASNRYVKGPFVIEGVIYGFISSIIALSIFLPLTYYSADFVTKLFGMSLFDHFIDNFINIAGMIFFSGIALGVVSSYLAVRKYLKI